jgi:hypothetical protein
MLSSFGKYLPGKVMAIAGMVALSERAGISGKPTVGAAIVMQVLNIGTGVAAAALTLGPEVTKTHPYAAVAMLLLGVVTLGTLLAVGNRTVSSALWKLARRPGAAPEPPSLALLGFGIAINVLTWVAYGGALIWLAKGILPVATLEWRQATGAFAFAYLAGYLGPAPGGLGARDAALVWFLTPWIGIAEALALAAASRLMFTFNELGAAAPFFFSKGQSRDTT